MIKLLTKRTVGDDSNNILANGRYALVGMVVKESTLADKTTITYYVPLLASVSENNQITGVSVVLKDDLRTRPIPKIGFDGNGNTMLSNNEGTFINAIDAQYKAHKGANIDVVWFRDILGNLRGQVFNLSAEIFQAISRKGNRYTTAVYKADLVAGATPLNLNDTNIQAQIRTFANTVGFTEVLGMNPAEPLQFCDEAGNAVTV